MIHIHIKLKKVYSVGYSVLFSVCFHVFVLLAILSAITIRVLFPNIGPVRAQEAYTCPRLRRKLD